MSAGVSSSAAATAESDSARVVLKVCQQASVGQRTQVQGTAELEDNCVDRVRRDHEEAFVLR